MDEKNFLLAPPGCLQYYTDTVGHFRSFNLGKNLRDLYYAVCFRIDNGYSGIRFTSNYFGMHGPFCKKRPEKGIGGFGRHNATNFQAHPHHLVIPPPGYAMPPPRPIGMNQYPNPYGPLPGTQSIHAPPRIITGSSYPTQKYKRDAGTTTLNKPVAPNAPTSARTFDHESKHDFHSHKDKDFKHEEHFHHGPPPPPPHFGPPPPYFGSPTPPGYGPYGPPSIPPSHYPPHFVEFPPEHPESHKKFSHESDKKTWWDSKWLGKKDGDKKGDHWMWGWKSDKKDDKFDKFDKSDKYEYKHPSYGYGPPPGYGPPVSYGYEHGYGGYNHGGYHHKEIDKFGKKYEHLEFKHEKNHKDKDDKKDEKGWWFWGKKDDKKGKKDKDKFDSHHEALFPMMNIPEMPHCEPRFCGQNDVITFPPSGDSIAEMCGNRFNRGRGPKIISGSPLVVYVSNRGHNRGAGFDMNYEQVFYVPRPY